MRGINLRIPSLDVVTHIPGVTMGHIAATEERCRVLMFTSRDATLWIQMPLNNTGPLTQMRGPKCFAKLGKDQIFASTTNRMSYNDAQYERVAVRYFLVGFWSAVVKVLLSSFLKSIPPPPSAKFHRSRPPPSGPSDFSRPCLCTHEKVNYFSTAFLSLSLVKVLLLWLIMYWCWRFYCWY